jgi:cytochrome c oxidase subunit 2
MARRPAMAEGAVTPAHGCRRATEHPAPRRVTSASIACTTLLAGCAGIQSTLDPHSPDAERIAALTWVLLGGGAAIFVLVMALLTYVMLWPQQRGWLASNTLIMVGGVLFPVVTLASLLIYSMIVVASMSTADEDALQIEVTAYQWWWEVRYFDEAGTVAFVTANEIHIPIDRPVLARVTSADVIHSFWIPNLAGKVDMIPGHRHELPFEASSPGTFRGQCAEYCGGPHGWMAFHVVAQAPETFAAWYERERAPAREPQTPEEARGGELFSAYGCGVCHTIRGTPAVGQLGPDLTHTGSRSSIGAGMMPNNVDTLARWMADNQQIKPRNRMPGYDRLPSEDIRAIALYLEGLE